MYYHHRLSQFSTQSYGPFGLAGTSNTDSGRETQQRHQHSSRSHAGHSIGHPIPFVTGQFAGNTVRAELYEIQKADLGRKYARVDRRPLDPPPVVALRLFHITEGGDERELPNDTIQSLGLVCTVDLFPVPESENAPEKSTQQRSNSYSPTKSRQHTRRTSSTSLSGSSPSHSPQSPYTPQDAYFHRQQPPRIAENTVDSTRYFELSAGGFGEQYNEHHANAVAGSHFESNTHHFQFPQAEYPVFPARSSQQEQHQDTSAGGSHPQPSPALRQQGPEPEDRQNTSPSQAEEEPIHRVNGLPVYEGMQVTHALVGAKFVQPTPVDWRGQKTLMFVFSDLAVKIEGQFILRYRAFDIYSRAAGHNSDLVVQAECYGEPFRVYSTKEFPGLQASTELTKLIARYGVRLNIRETERKRRKLSGGGRAIGGNRNRSSDGDEDEYEEDYGDGNA